MKSVGIDIGRFSIKLAEVEATQRSFTLTRLEEFPLSNDPTKDTEIEVIDILRTLSQQFDQGATTFVIGMSQKQVIVRQRQFPFRERHKILKTVPFELEDDIPFSGENAIFDAKITRYRGQGAEVLACTSPLDRIKAQLQRARDGNIEPGILCPEGMAFSNLFEQWSDPPLEGPPMAGGQDTNEPSLPETPERPKAQAILTMGHRSSFMIVRTEDRLLTIRTLDWGGLDVAQALALKYQLHIVEALKEMRHKGFILTSNEGATRDQIAFSDVIKGVVDDLAHELHLAFLEIESDQNISISQLFLCGGVAQLRHLGPYLTQKLEIPCNRLKQISGNASLNFEGGNGGEISGAVAIALAIEGLKRPRNPAVNMLRGALAKQSQTLKVLVAKWGHTLAVASAAFITLLIWSVLRESFSVDMADQAYEQMKIQAQNVTGGDLKGSRANPTNIRRFIKEKEQEAKNRKLAEKVQTISSALEVLKALSESTPGKKSVVMDVSSLTINNDQVEVQGLLSSPNQLNTLIKDWKNLAIGGKIEKFQPSMKAPKEKVAFGLRFRVERLKGG